MSIEVISAHSVFNFTPTYTPQPPLPLNLFLLPDPGYWLQLQASNKMAAAVSGISSGHSNSKEEERLSLFVALSWE